MANKKILTEKKEKITVTPKAKVVAEAAVKKDLASDKSKKSVDAAHEISVDMYGKEGKIIGKISLPKEIFDSKINTVLMAQAVRVYRANQRMGTASTKTRGEVRGSTRKIYRQKGTGRARHGAITAPIFVGGGIVFGPRPRDFTLKMPTKMRRKALFSALTMKHRNNTIKIADLGAEFSKTREMQKAFKALELIDKNNKGDNILFVVSDMKHNSVKVTQNIGGVSVQHASDLHTYQVLKAKRVVFMKDSIEVLKNTFIK